MIFNYFGFRITMREIAQSLISDSVIFINFLYQKNYINCTKKLKYLNLKKRSERVSVHCTNRSKKLKTKQ